MPAPNRERFLGRVPARPSPSPDIHRREYQRQSRGPSDSAAVMWLVITVRNAEPLRAVGPSPVKIRNAGRRKASELDRCAGQVLSQASANSRPDSKRPSTIIDQSPALRPKSRPVAVIARGVGLNPIAGFAVAVSGTFIFAAIECEPYLWIENRLFPVQIVIGGRFRSGVTIGIQAHPWTGS